MKLSQRHLLFVVVAVAAAAWMNACAQDDPISSDSAYATESVVRSPASEPLQSGSLKQLVCDAIVAAEGAGAHDAQCTGFVYTVTEYAKSTQYGHLEDDGVRPITMQMKVFVENPATGDTYDAILSRTLTHEFLLKWQAEIAETELQQIHDYIRDLADEVGEYADWYEPALQDKVRPLSWEQVPPHMQSVFEQTLAARLEWLNPDGQGDSAMFSDEAPFLEILMAGVVVGYVLNIDDYIDHPLWDGSGIHYYFDTYGTEVTSVDWTG